MHSRKIVLAVAVVLLPAVSAHGSIVGWGRNHIGQTDVPDGSDFTAIAAGAYHSLALRADPALVLEPLSVLVWGGLTCFAALVINRRERV